MPDITLYMKKHGIRGGKGQTPLEKAEARLNRLLGQRRRPGLDDQIRSTQAEVDRLRIEEERYING